MKAFQFLVVLLMTTIFVFGNQSVTTQPVTDNDDSISVAEQLQQISVTLSTESNEGSGVIIKRGDRNYILTAAHVIARLKKTRKVIDPRTGTEKTIIEFDDASIMQMLYEEGRKVGKVEMLAKVVCYSNAEDGEDLAVLRVRKKDFVNNSAIFYLNLNPPSVGTDLYHVGSMTGQFGSNSVTTGVVSQIGRIYENKTYDQVSCPVMPGSCLPMETLISLADGTIKKIVDIQAGDQVLCYANVSKRMHNNVGNYNLRSINRGTVSKVIEAGEKPIFEIRTQGKMLRASGNHPVVKMHSVQDISGKYVNVPMWTRVDELQEGDIVATLRTGSQIPGEDRSSLSGDLKYERITTIVKCEPEMTYDLSIDKYHNFFANGFLVHNSGAGVFLKNGQYVGMVVRGAGETLSLIVPMRRIKIWMEKMGIMFIIDPLLPILSDEEVDKILIEDTGKVFEYKGDADKKDLSRHITTLQPFLIIDRVFVKEEYDNE